MHDHAGEFGGDPNKIVLLGHSAGCHLVTLVALDPRYLAKVGLRPADLRGVVAWSGGSYDLVQKVEQGAPMPATSGRPSEIRRPVRRDASPVEYVKNAKGCPPFLFVSNERGSASHRAAERMATLIGDAGGQATSKLIEGRDHFGANHLLGAPDDATGAIVLEFVTEVTKYEPSTSGFKR